MESQNSSDNGNVELLEILGGLCGLQLLLNTRSVPDTHCIKFIQIKFEITIYPKNNPF